MISREEIIYSTLSKMEVVTDVGSIVPMEDESYILETYIKLTIEDQNFPFKVQVYPQYPFKLRELETIRFINEDYLEYNHVNPDGSICILTDHNPDLKTKLEIDINGLIDWINKYVIIKSQDEHYEHILVPNEPIDGIGRNFLFTDVDYPFKNGDFGVFNYAPLLDGKSGKSKTQTLVVQEFHTHKVKCDWNSYYSHGNEFAGFYYFSDTPPVSKQNLRLAASNWNELEGYFSQEFLYALWLERKSNKKLKNNTLIPLLIGYPIGKKKNHWVATMFKTTNFPNYAEKTLSLSGYVGKLKDQSINWVGTYDCTYEMFFGRGRLSDDLVSRNVLILGIGAIGSILAKSLTRGGLREISLFDYDVKEPGNICRSEYPFISGITNKTEDLAKYLLSISPFVNPSYSEVLTDILKSVRGNNIMEKSASEFLNEYDLIFDCTTDNDMLYFLDSLNLDSKLISMSITNGAKELVCCQGKGIYNRTQTIFKTLKNSESDMFNPTGCWSPTFKASYNDIAVLVESAIKHLNGTFENGTEPRDFVMQSEWDNGFNLTLKQF
jgi:hypothetical protein